MVKQKIIPLLMLPIILFTMFGEYITTASATSYNVSLSEETYLSYHDEIARSFFASNSISTSGDYLIYGYQGETSSTLFKIELSAFYFTSDTTWTIDEYNDITRYTMSSGKYYYIDGTYVEFLDANSQDSYSLDDYWGVTSDTSCKIEFDKEGNVIAFIGFNNNYWYKESSYASGYWYDDIFQLEGLSNNNALDLSVSFTPSLEGTVDRLIDQNGVQAESNYFSMTLTNNAPGNAQYMMCIVPSGSAVNFAFEESDFSTGLDKSSNGIFYFTLQEWVYTSVVAYADIGFSGFDSGFFDKNSDSLAGSLRANKEVSQNTFWHVISGSSSITHNFNWAQINITKDTSYDVVVIGLPTDLTKPSKVFYDSNSPYYLNLSTAQEVYRSTFTVPNPVTYDPNNTEFGNSPNNGFTDAENDALVLNGYYDTSGNPVISDVDFSANQDEFNSGVPSLKVDDLSDLSLDDVKGLLSQTESFFDFLGVCFSWLPGWFWAILLFGVTALVIIGVVKALL